MHRQPLLVLLARYEGAHPDERAVVARIRALCNAHPDCFDRTCLPGHMTGSAWIVSPDGRRHLLTRHRKLKRWLQPGGHADGDPQAARVARREAEEESGIQEFTFVQGMDTALDLDVHVIPARGDEPEHEHHDIRFLLVAGSDRLAISDESDDLRWFTDDTLCEVTQEESVLRMLRKARAVLGTLASAGSSGTIARPLEGNQHD